ncbi:MAG TPA: ABC transporter permease [Vicinamibacterales bacterium]|nr:ABC transporter permease [Vicinamibacterales bacterium]
MILLRSDIRFAVRMLTRSPGFAAAVIVIMALGIGANSAVFTALDQAVVRSLPYRDADRLTMVWEDFSAIGGAKSRVSPRTFLDWKERVQTFDDLAAYGLDARNLSGSGTPEEISAIRVTSNLIPLLGVSPLVGRTFTKEEEGPETRAVVISYRLWSRKFNRDRAVIGKQVLLNEVPYEVIGVMPPGFDYPSRLTEIWLPFGLSPDLLERRNSHFLRVLGRLKAGVEIGRAQAELDRIANELAIAYPNSNAQIGIKVTALKDEMLGDTRLAFVVLSAAAACILLIACANIGNLLLARAANRRQEVAIRLALGARPVQVLSALLVESLVLAAIGAIGGLLVANWSLAVLQPMIPASLAGFVQLHLDGRALAFTAIITALASVLFGLAPALNVWQGIPTVRSAIGGASKRLRGVLVAAEIAVTLVLMVGAGLLVQTLARLRAVDPGFRTPSILTANINIPLPKYEDATKRRRFYNGALAAVRAIPGVTAIGLTSDLPYTSRGNTMSLAIEGQAAAQAAANVGQDALFRLVSSDYLQTIGARLTQGRFLNDSDGPDTVPVVVVNEALARQFWPTESALGHRINTGTGVGAPRWMTIVGIVADIRERGPDLANKAAVYVPFMQTDITFFQPSEIAVLTTREPIALANELQQAIWSVDPEQPLSNIRTMDAIVDEELAVRSQVLRLVGTFAALALILSTLGIYAVLSYVVSQRTREIGLRMAIGAQRGDIATSVLVYSARVTTVGIVAGVIAGVSVTRVMTALLFGVTPLDWKTFAGVAIVLEAVALLSSYLPARKATMVDPVVALRHE